MRVVGIDLSLTSTGLADSDGAVMRVRTEPRKGTRPYDDDWRRIYAIRESVRDFGANSDLWVLEGPSLGSKGGHAHTRSGLWWQVYERADRPIAVVTPGTRMIYATGNGNAGKDACLAAVVKRYSGFDVTGNDVADAVTLMAMGARWLGYPVEDSLPKTHLRAMAAADWPKAVAA